MNIVKKGQVQMQHTTGETTEDHNTVIPCKKVDRETTHSSRWLLQYRTPYAFKATCYRPYASCKATWYTP